MHDVIRGSPCPCLNPLVVQDMKTKVYLPSSYNEVAARFAELVTNHLNDDTRDAFFGGAPSPRISHCRSNTCDLSPPCTQ